MHSFIHFSKDEKISQKHQQISLTINILNFWQMEPDGSFNASLKMVFTLYLKKLTHFLMFNLVIILNIIHFLYLK